MRRVRLSVLYVLMVVIAIASFVGCSMESAENIPSESSRLTPYAASGFGDLLSIEDVTVLTDDALKNVDLDTYSLTNDVVFALGTSNQTGLLGLLQTIIPSKKSMSAALSMQVRDEVIEWEVDSYDYTTTINHLDLELEGGLSSISTILGLIPEALVPDSVTGAASIKLSSKIHTSNSASGTPALEFSESIYLSLDANHTETISSRTDDGPVGVPISGPICLDFKYSLASLFSPLPGDDVPAGITSVFEIELKPIRNLTLQPIVNALIEAEFEGPTIPDPSIDEEDMAEFRDAIEELFDIVKPLIWGNNTEPALRISRKVMKSNGDIVVLKEATDAEALVTLLLTTRSFN